MITLGFPNLNISSDAAVATSGDKRKVLQNLYLSPSISITCAAKTVSKANTIVAPKLFITPNAKTRVIAVAVPNLVLSLVASGKTISKSALAIRLIEPDTNLHLQMSSKIVSRASIKIKLISLAQKIHSASTVLITEPYFANLVQS